MLGVKVRREFHQPMSASLRPALPVAYRLLAAASLLLAMAGCASVPKDPAARADYEQTNDPLEPTNRVIYVVDDALDVVLIRPLALAYHYGTPHAFQTGTHNVLANLNTPVVLFNDMLEGNPRRAGDTLMRGLINTTVGLVGVFDVATGWGYPAHNADFGITLALWGMPDGPYLYLPVFGPSSPRNALGTGGDYLLDPFTWVGKGYLVSDFGYTRLGLTAVDTRAAYLSDLDKMKAQALDPYATLRSLYRQHRESEIEAARTDEPATVPAWYPPPAK
jgi:phospholipid-binding lipoprotein MlaA